jgi:hypothetical protein
MTRADRKHAAVIYHERKMAHHDVLMRVLAAAEQLTEEMFGGDIDTVEALRGVLEDKCEEARLAEGRLHAAFQEFKATMTVPGQARG